MCANADCSCPNNYPLERAQLARWCRSRTRSARFSERAPVDWNPQSVINPATGLSFAEDSAWRFAAEMLDAGFPMKRLVLKKPPGAIAFEMVIVGFDAVRGDLYIKLQPAGDRVHGRSFHYSYRL
jgi:hypothetical protein